MNVLTDPRIESLRKTAGESGKLDYAVGTNYFQRVCGLMFWTKLFSKGLRFDDLDQTIFKGPAVERFNGLINPLAV